MSNYYTTATACGNVTSGGTTVYTATLPSTDVYTIQVRNQLPSAVFNGGTKSTVVTTIKHNGSTVATSNAGDFQVQAQFQATAADTISVVLASSTAVDQAINAVKSTIIVSEGQAEVS